MGSPAVSIDGVWKNFRLYQEKNQHLKSTLLRGRRARYEEFWALKGIDFEIEHGESLGIIGSNGSGKSTLLKCLAGILTPDRGRVTADGRVVALLELGAGFHPELSGRENVYMNGAILGMSRGQIDRSFDDIVDFSGLEKFIDTPVKNYSSGMVVRLGFAVATNVDPEILVIDEVLAVGDASFQQRCYERIAGYRQEGRTIIFVSHGLAQVTQLCSRAVWIDKGELRMDGPAYEVTTEYSGDSHHAQKPTEGTGERWGTGEITIESISVTGARPDRPDDVETGSEFNITVEYEVHSPCKEMVVGIRIATIQGVTVVGTNTKRRAVRMEPRLGHGTVSFKVDRMPLLEGVYSLTVAITDQAEAHEYDHWEDRVRFSVVQHGIFDEGLVNIGGEWINEP